MQCIKKNLRSNNFAVIGLPLRLTASLIIGITALSIILSFILNPCLFAGKMIVNIEPMINSIPSGSDEHEFSITVTITDKDGYSVKDASVLIKGLGDAASDITDPNGEVIIKIKPRLEEGVQEGYLDILVKAGCMEEFQEENIIKIIRGRP